MSTRGKNIFMVSGDLGIASGVENIFRHTLREFSRYWDHVDICVPPAPGAEAVTLFGNVHVHPCDRSKLAFPSFITDTGKKVLAERPIDVVCAHSYPFFLNEAGASRVARMAGAAYIVEVMHVIGHPRATDLDERIRRWLSRVAYRRICEPAHLVRVINTVEVPEFLCGKAGVPEEKILVRPCFYLDFEKFFPPAEIECRGRHVLYSGRLAKNKGLRELCEALSQVHRNREITFTVLGDGEMKSKMAKWVCDLGLHEVTTFRGHVPHTELGDLYREADVLVMPSRNEGGPRVTLEAMACGTPVISSRVGIMHEVIEDGVNGLFCGWDANSIAAQLDRLLGDEEFCRRVAEASAPAVQRFEYSSVIRDYAEAYLEAADRFGTASRK